MADPLTREQLGEFAAGLLDITGEIEQPILGVAFAVAVRNTDGTDGIITKTTHPYSLANIKLFHRAAELEHVCMVQAAERAIEQAEGGEE